MSLAKFNIQKKYVKKLKNGSQTGIMVKKKNNQVMKTQDIRKLYDNLVADDENIRIIIRALSPTGWSTLANLQDGLMLQDYEEYFQGHVVDTSKFNQFTELELVILK